MDMVVEYANELNLDSNIIAPINHVQISKRIVLPYELVGFSWRRKTWEAIEYKESSCIMWKCRFEMVPKPSRKSYKL